MTYFKPEEKHKFQGAKIEGQDEEEMQIKLEDFENLKEEVRKHLDE